MERLENIIHRRLARAVPDAIAALSDELRGRLGNAVSAVIFYGSCLRKGDPLDGVVDLYVIVSSYAAAYPGRLVRVLARFLPPTVGYLECDTPQGRVRAKYAVISLRDFRRGTGGRWFHPYLWGRFSQPCALGYVRDEADGRAVASCLADSARTLIRSTMALAPMPADALDLWVDGLDLSYGTELRPEASSRARELVEADADFYREIMAALAPDVGLAPTGGPDPGHPRYSARLSPWRIRRARAAWAVRRVTGKLLSPVRWLKALATFEGGLDYAAWKLERHSGAKIQIPDRVRRRPWLHVWGELWRLYRSGILR